jgi:hypothetical protein
MPPPRKWLQKINNLCTGLFSLIIHIETSEYVCEIKAEREGQWLVIKVSWAGGTRTSPTRSSVVLEYVQGGRYDCGDILLIG